MDGPGNATRRATRFPFFPGFRPLATVAVDSRADGGRPECAIARPPPTMTTTSPRKPTLTERLTRWAGKRSPWVLHVNTGSCNGCDIEIIDALTPRFDVERFGITLVDTPRHADVLLVTGPVTRQMAPRLKRLYEQTPNPKHVIAVGTCATSGGVFHGHYNTLGGVDSVIPVDMYVPGCPVSPEALIDAIYKLLEADAAIDEAALPDEARLERPESMESLPDGAILDGEATGESPPNAAAAGDER